MNDSKTPITKNFNPLPYEEIHRNLDAIFGLLEGMAWWEAAGDKDDPKVASLFKLADMVAVEAERAKKFFNEAYDFYMEVKHG